MAGMDRRRAPVRVLGRLSEGTIRVLVWPGKGMADGGIPMEFPLEVIPPDLRTPNTEFFVIFAGDAIVEIQRSGPTADGE